MNTNIKIKPYPVTSATQAVIGEAKVNLDLGTVTIPISLCDDEGKTLKTEHVKIAGPEYSKWGSNDNYIVELALKELGISLEKNQDQPVVTTAPAEVTDAPQVTLDEAAITAPPEKPKGPKGGK